VPETVKVGITERDDIADLLGLIPEWTTGAIIWYVFSKTVLDSLSEKKPGTEINAAIIASDVAGVTFPPGVALAAQIDVSLTFLEVFPDIAEKIIEGAEIFREQEVAQPLAPLTPVQEIVKVVLIPFLIITGALRA